MSSITTNDLPVTITALHAFSDNYIWAINNDSTAALVDPGDADVCIRFLEKNQIVLNAILITHHHADHTGGIKKLIAYCQQKQWPLTIYGPAQEEIPHCDIKLTENDRVTLSELDIELTVIDVPGHTTGHIAYFRNTDIAPILFCGDTLFSGGCGRIFEGTAKQMLASLTKLKDLPENTKVYCAHEYTQANLKFALAVEPENNDLINYNKKVNELREKNQITIPTSIKIEKQINPFLRSNIKTVQKSAMAFDNSTKTDDLKTFTTIRRWKDQF
jgi:hydroxyacylglutathione hydrolase